MNPRISKKERNGAAHKCNGRTEGEPLRTRCLAIWQIPEPPNPPQAQGAESRFPATAYLVSLGVEECTCPPDTSRRMVMAEPPLMRGIHAQTSL